MWLLLCGVIFWDRGYVHWGDPLWHFPIIHVYFDFDKLPLDFPQKDNFTTYMEFNNLSTPYPFLRLFDYYVTDKKCHLYSNSYKVWHTSSSCSESFSVYWLFCASLSPVYFVLFTKNKTICSSILCWPLTNHHFLGPNFRLSHKIAKFRSSKETRKLKLENYLGSLWMRNKGCCHQEG